MSQKKAVEELAKSWGVAVRFEKAAPNPADGSAEKSLAPGQNGAAGAPKAGGEGSGGINTFMRAHMPAAFDLVKDIARQLGPELWAGARDNLKAGRGWVHDHASGLVVGGAPAGLDAGKAAVREGYPVRRVKPPA